MRRLAVAASLALWAAGCGTSSGDVAAACTAWQDAAAAIDDAGQQDDPAVRRAVESAYNATLDVDLASGSDRVVVSAEQALAAPRSGDGSVSDEVGLAMADAFGACAAAGEWDRCEGAWAIASDEVCA